MENVTNIQRSQFAVGDLVHHRLFDYRGVVVDVDPVFQLAEDWYDAVALSRPPKDKPWYHVLVDGAVHATYVAERNLKPDNSTNPVQHPLLESFFSHFEEGHYLNDNKMN